MATSGGCGSLTLTTISASANTAWASGTIRAPCAVYSSSPMADPTPGAGLHQDLMAVLDELAHTRRRQRDPVLVRLDLGGNADAHKGPFSSAILGPGGRARSRCG